MNKSKLFGLLIALLLCNVTYGQYNNFDLSKYKLPDIKTSRLDFNANLNNDYNNEIQQILTNDTIKEISNVSSGYLDIDYYHFRNSEKYQGSLSINVGVDPNLNKLVYQETTTKDNFLKANISAYSENRFFLKNLMFVEADPHVFFITSIEKNKSESDIATLSLRDENDYVANLSIPISIGYGRIEPVEDARLAIYILEELNKAGRISNLPTDDKIIEMAGTISKIKNKRFFDTRIRKIREFQVIDSFLVANNIISENDINYFSILNDNWDYANGPLRESGFSANIGIDNDILISSNKLNITEPTELLRTSKRNEYSIGGFLNVRYAKPINLYWQTTAYFQPYYNLGFYRDPEQPDSRTDNTDYNNLGTKIGGTIQYLPNSRTSIIYSIGGTCSISNSNYIYGMELVNVNLNTNSFSVNQGINVNYYISPRFRIQLNSNFTFYGYRMTEEYESTYDNDEDFMRYKSNYLTAKFIYSIF